MIAALKRIGADVYFDHFFSQIELGVKKPDPEFFIRTARLSGYDQKTCLMVGNLYDKDIVGAKEAGMVTVFFNELCLKGSFPNADYTIQHMSELTQLFDE